MNCLAFYVFIFNISKKSQSNRYRLYRKKHLIYKKHMNYFFFHVYLIDLGLLSFSKLQRKHMLMYDTLISGWDLVI